MKRLLLLALAIGIAPVCLAQCGQPSPGGWHSDCAPKVPPISRGTPPPPPPTGTPLSACADLTKAGVYYLTQDVTAPGTCFFDDADGVTLNLNGFTVTYGTGGGSAGTPGILLADSWYTGSGYSLAETGSTDKHGGFVVYGGKILASVDAAPQSHGIWAGQSNDLTPAPVIHDLTIATQGEDSKPIFGTATPSGWQIYNNTLAYMSETTSSRYDFLGYALWLGDNLNAPSNGTPDAIYSNTITNAAQGGIFVDHQDAVIGPANDITFDSFYANDYCVIDYAGDGQVIKGNICHPTSGRGIDVESANVQVLDNTITVTELPQNAEYSGCEAGGADGIRARCNSAECVVGGNQNPSEPNGVVLQGNTIEVVAGSCQAVGLRFTALIAKNSISILDNSVTTSGAGTLSVPDYDVSFDGDEDAALTFTGNTFSAKYAWWNVDWDGAAETIATGQTYTGTPALALYNGNGYQGGTAQGGPTFLQSIAIANLTAGKILCGTWSAGPSSFGSTSTTCNGQKQSAKRSLTEVRRHAPAYIDSAR